MKDRRFEISERLRAKLKILSEEMAGKVKGGIDDSIALGCGGVCEVTCSWHCRPDCMGFCGDLGAKT